MIALMLLQCILGRYSDIILSLLKPDARYLMESYEYANPDFSGKVNLFLFRLALFLYYCFLTRNSKTNY